MSLQYERIEKFCQQLKLDRLSTEWPAVAQATIDKNGTHADFLESILRLQYEGLTERRRQTILRLSGLPVIHEFRNLQKRSINLKPRKNQGVHILSGYPCIKDIYKTFLQVSSLRYSSLALSEVSPSPLAHDTVSRWLKSSTSFARTYKALKIAKIMFYPQDVR